MKHFLYIQIIGLSTMQDVTTNYNEIIRIIGKYIIRRAFKLFGNETRLSSLQRMVGSLRLTSKSLNKSICDELSLEIMHRWMKGLERAALVTKRINQLLQKCDYTSLYKFMAVVVKVFARRESVRLLSSFLITITQHHKHILKDYITFFTSRRLHMTIREYYAEQRNFPFPGFKPEHVEKALQIANENGWIEESIFIFEHFSSHYLSINQNHSQGIKIRTALQNGEKLNFDARLGNRISNKTRKREDILYFTARDTVYQPRWLFLYFATKQCTTTDLMTVLSNITTEQASHILKLGTNSRLCQIISFRGAALLKYCYSYWDSCRPGLLDISIDPSKTKTFTGLILEPEYRQQLYLYPFYCAIVTNDIEQVKRIQQQYGITVDHFGQQPHPLREYLTAIKTKRIVPMQEMIDYLVQHFDGVQMCMYYDPYTKEQAERLWSTLKQLIDKGAEIYDNNVWVQLFKDKTPRNVRQFKMLLDGVSGDRFSFIITFLLDKFSKMSAGMITETKLLLLLAWKYGGNDCHLTTLPKELLKLIMEFVDEPPLFIQYAQCVVEKSANKIYFVGEISSETLERTGEIAKFLHTNKSNNTWAFLKYYVSQRAIKRDAKYLTEMFVDNHLYFSSERVHQYFCKYGTNERLLEILAGKSNYYTDYPILEYAAVAKNMKLLHAFYRYPKNAKTILNEELYAKVAPNRKDRMSFDEALELVNQVRRQYVT